MAFQFSRGQENGKGAKLLSISVGGNLSNLMNSEAPHKIYIIGSDIRPGIVSYPITRSGAYFDYSTNILKDMKSGLVVDAGIEYFLKDRLSICVAVAYEEKGIDLDYKRSEATKVTTNFPSASNANTPPPYYYIQYYDEFFAVKLHNGYLAMPVSIRQYFSGTRFYVSAGGFVARLMAADVYKFQRKHYYTSSDYAFESDSYAEIKHHMHEHEEFTSTFDCGLSLGTGLSYPLTNRLFANVDLLISLGFRKVDGKYNNEYEERTVPSTNGFELLVRSTNYFGLNSNATNITAALTFGIGYKIP
jgi:hypothetical protein